MAKADKKNTSITMDFDTPLDSVENIAVTQVNKVLEPQSKDTQVIKFLGTVPDRAYDSAGFDLIAKESKEIYPKTTASISTGVYVEIPKGYVGLVKGRSGLAFKQQLEAFQGVIDSDYRGEIKVQLFNRGVQPRFIKSGIKFAQLVIVPCITNAVAVDKLSDTPRSDKGFGSSSSE